MTNLDPSDFPPIPLTASEFQPQALTDDLMSTAADELFPNARDAQASLAGFLLLAGHWDLSHKVSQDIPSREGSYWHAIAHRIEPDTWNSSYWFRRVGQHPIFDDLHADATALLASSRVGWRLKNAWDPDLFLTWCDEARALVGSEKHQIACQIQRLECNLLFSWCAVKRKDLQAIQR